MRTEILPKPVIAWVLTEKGRKERPINKISGNAGKKLAGYYVE